MAEKRKRSTKAKGRAKTSKPTETEHSHPHAVDEILAADDKSTIEKIDPSYGLEWKVDTPIWTETVSTEHVANIAYRHLNLSAEEIAQTTAVEAFRGGFHKLWAVECPRGSFLMRLTLPVDPHFKTSSEIATISAVRSQTTVPVPDIIASNSSNDNEAKFEWTLMKRIPGVTLDRVELLWDSRDAQVSAIKQVAGFMAQLFELRYDAIGNLYHVKDLDRPEASKRGSRKNSIEPDSIVLGQMVSGNFYAKTHLKSSVHRGPFASSKDWLEALFRLVKEELTHISKSKKAYEVENAKKGLSLLKRLQKQFKHFFNLDHRNNDDREEFSLYHHAVAERNLLSDSTGKLQALLDWESVSVMPLWIVCQFPSFICGKDRKDQPVLEDYGSEDDDGDSNAGDLSGRDRYSRHLDDYEDTRLRQEFLAEMAKLSPQWVEEHQKSKRKRDFLLALDSLLWTSAATDIKGISAWLDRIEAGEEYRELEIW